MIAAKIEVFVYENCHLAASLTISRQKAIPEILHETFMIKCEIIPLQYYPHSIPKKPCKKAHPRSGF